MTNRLRGILSLEDFEAAARRVLPRPIFGYVSGGCETDASLHGNRAAFGEYGFVTRVLQGVAQRTQATSLLGHSWSAPFGIAPMGMCALSAYRGDIVLARAAAAANIPMLCSGTGLIALEEVRQANRDAWFQAYVPGEPQRIEALIERVARAGYGTLVITAGTAVSGNRENHVRVGFSSPLRPSAALAWQGLTHPRWLVGTALRTLLRHGMPHFENSQATRGAPILARHAVRDFGARDHLGWEHLRLIRTLWKGRLVVKGIMNADDARLARDCGAEGIIVSNHGGRQLDGAVSPLRVLPAVVEAVPDTPVMMDGGIRRGNDVLKAIALGAGFVFVGRPFIYAAAVAGEAGVRHAIATLQQEIHRNMALLGITRLEQVRQGRVVPGENTAILAATPDDPASMRSKLFVPGSRPELFAKALAGEADAVSIDLEDAVPESRKVQAREGVAAWLRTRPATGGRQVIVRVNAMDTPHFEADLAAVVQPGLHVLNLPKPQSPQEVRAASEAIARAERANGVTDPVGLLLNIETSRALREAAAIASADPRVMGLQVGLGDLFEPLGIDRQERAAVQHVLLAVRLAAGEAGVPAFDGAYADVRDTEGYLAEAQLARRLGFAGKTCIHPSQVPLANAAFRPTDAEIAHALKVSAAADEAQARGLGAWLVDGRMIDRPFLQRAQAIVATARRLRLLPDA
ncbi:candidate bifunctional protein : L-lactate dehydrogenase;Citrate (pro-3S)-lyase [Ramlibacter tataouinensis TTB310]|uniref:Candidate bifunctional protein: L-lactate dehydrogenaseCitrate (Pro-3S)-lyase n=2 Tax=Ramlibacter tataouinensis TaxID=94132 RepID=F5Y6G8_RAMTT|nr:candidate bifunctional protein : L-lactate dehydrogenase;Citrate (pro-3S)-lyase [Ramlibacter tataouinensis TTB310]